MGHPFLLMWQLRWPFGYNANHYCKLLLMKDFIPLFLNSHCHIRHLTNYKQSIKFWTFWNCEDIGYPPINNDNAHVYTHLTYYL